MSQENPWKTLDSTHIYSNPWMSVREDRVIRPDGTEGVYGVVEARTACAVVALTPEHEIYLVGQYRYTTNTYSWEVIAGGADRNEPPMETAKRELKEEAGILAKQWHVLGENIQMSNCFTSEIGHIFLATDLTLTDANPDDTEILALKKIPLTETLTLIDSGEITDAFSIMAIFLTARWLESNP